MCGELRTGVEREFREMLPDNPRKTEILHDQSVRAEFRQFAERIDERRDFRFVDNGVVPSLGSPERE